MALLDEIDKLRTQVRDFDMAVYEWQQVRIQAFRVMRIRANLWAQAAWDMHNMYPKDASMFRREAQDAEARASMLTDLIDIERGTLKLLANRLERYRGA